MPRALARWCKTVCVRVSVCVYVWVGCVRRAQQWEETPERMTPHLLHHHTEALHSCVTFLFAYSCVIHHIGPSHRLEVYLGRGRGSYSCPTGKCWQWARHSSIAKPCMEKKGKNLFIWQQINEWVNALTVALGMWNGNDPVLAMHQILILASWQLFSPPLHWQGINLLGKILNAQTIK